MDVRVSRLYFGTPLKGAGLAVRREGRFGVSVLMCKGTSGYALRGIGVEVGESVLMALIGR